MTGSQMWTLRYPDGAAEVVEAFQVRHDQGSLLLTDDRGLLLTAIAPGEWTSIARTTAAELAQVAAARP